MAAEQTPRPKVKRVEEFRDVFDFIDQVRARPGMWVRGGALRDLENMLSGYWVALGVHGVAEGFAFGPQGSFPDWLQQRYGWPMSLGWADAIEKYAGQGPALDEFFRLVDEFRATER